LAGKFFPLLALWFACSAPQVGGAPPTPLQVSRVPVAAEVTPEPATDAPAPLTATLIGQVSEGTFGPYLGATRQGAAVALWATSDEQGKRRWFSVALDAKGAPLAAPRSLADAPSDLVLAKLVASHGGFVALITRTLPGGTRVEALSLSGTGELLAGPVLLEQGARDVVWIEALANGPTPLGVWASVHAGAAQLRIGGIDFSGRPASASRVIEGAKAWQAVEFSDGVAVAAVIAGSREDSDVLRVYFLGADATQIAQTDVQSGKRLAPELDMARVGERLLLAWVEQDGLEQRVVVAALGADTKRVAGPEQVPALGSQRLFGIVPAAERAEDAFLVWEDLGQAPRGERRFRIGRVSADAKLDARRGELSFAGDARDRPEFARKGSALAALTRAPACARDAACGAQEPVPTYLEFGPDFEPLASEPLRLEPAAGQSVDLAWGLHCGLDGCAALGALPAVPVPVYGIELRARSTAWAPAARSLSRDAPRALEVRSVGETDPLADVVAAPVADGWLVAALTQFDENTPYVKRKTPAPDGRMGPLRALLSVRSIAKGQKSPGPVQVISYRARAPGGIALAGGHDGRALLLWTALDKQRPEVFATLLGRTGKPPLQRMLTQAAGQVSQLAAAVLPQGFVAAWIAEPKGEAQVFSARLGADLAPVAPPAPLSQGAGSAVALSLARRGDTAWVAWVQGNDHEQRLLLTRLDPKSAARLGEVRLLQRTEAGTLASPVLAARGDGALLAWIERPVVGSGGGRAWLLELDAEANPRGEPRAVRSTVGDVMAVRLACEADRCVGSLDCRPPNGALLEGWVWTPAAAGAAADEVRAWELLWRASAASDPPAYALAGGQIFYGDRRPPQGLLRRVGIEWP
jgi:hypothetical protein